MQNSKKEIAYGNNKRIDEIITGQINIPVTGSQNAMSAYLAYSTAAKRLPVIIIGSEIFGITSHIKEIANNIASLGYAAVVPDFYHRTVPNVDLPYNPEGRKEGLELLRQLKREEVVADIKAVVDDAGARYETMGKTGFLGFSSGGHIGYLAASQLPITATAIFYGGWIVNTDIPLSRPEPTVALTGGIARQDGKIMYFVGDEDKLISADQIEQMKQALVSHEVEHEIIVYPGVQHGFFCDARPETFDEAARNDAWKRVEQFFKAALKIE